MKTRRMVQLLILATGCFLVAPDADAVRPKKARKIVNRQMHKAAKIQNRGYVVKHRYPRYQRPDIETESLNIYSTPGGGIGFNYYEYDSDGWW